MIKTRYSVDKLALGLTLGIISWLRKAPDAALTSRLRTVIEADLLDEASIKTVIESLIDVHEKTVADPHASFDFAGTLADTLAHLARSDAIGHHVRKAVLQSQKAPSSLQQKMQSIESDSMANDAVDQYEMLDIIQEPSPESVDEVA